MQNLADTLETLIIVILVFVVGNLYSRIKKLEDSQNK